MGHVRRIAAAASAVARATCLAWAARLTSNSFVGARVGPGRAAAVGRGAAGAAVGSGAAEGAAEGAAVTM